MAKHTYYSLNDFFNFELFYNLCVEIVNEFVVMFFFKVHDLDFLNMSNRTVSGPLNYTLNCPISVDIDWKSVVPRRY